MAKFKEGDKIVVGNHPAIRREYVGRMGIVKDIVRVAEGHSQSYTVDLFGRRQEGINPTVPLLGIYFREQEIELEDASAEEKTLDNTLTLLKDIDTEIKEVQDAGYHLSKWGFQDQSSQAMYAAGTFSRLRARFVQALKDDGVDIEE